MRLPCLNAEEFTTKPDDDDPSSFDWPANQKAETKTRLKYFGAGHGDVPIIVEIEEAALLASSL